MSGKRVVRYQVPRLVNGERVWTPCEEFDTSEPAHAAWHETFFRDITDAYLRRTDDRGGRIGDAACHVFDAPPFLAFALEVMAALVHDRARAQALLHAF